jgi:hypothetical protein
MHAASNYDAAIKSLLSPMVHEENALDGCRSEGENLEMTIIRQRDRDESMEKSIQQLSNIRDSAVQVVSIYTVIPTTTTNFDGLLCHHYNKQCCFSERKF